MTMPSNRTTTSPTASDRNGHDGLPTDQLGDTPRAHTADRATQPGVDLALQAHLELIAMNRGCCA